MDIPALAQNDGAAADDANDAILGPLAGVSLGGDQQPADDWSIVPNKTLDTNDQSVVGDLAHKTAPVDPLPDFSDFQPAQPVNSNEPTNPQPAADPIATTVPENLPTPEIIDPDKEQFIKTYTEEFDLVIAHATDAVDKILVAIDNTVREHLPDIAIPHEIDEFIDTPPSDYKVEKFDDAQDIVKAVMDKANEAKQQSAAAAAEAAKVYDGVQQFKQQTREEIKNLTDGMDLDDVKKRAADERQPNVKLHDATPSTAKTDDHDKSSFVSSFIKDNAAKTSDEPDDK